VRMTNHAPKPAVEHSIQAGAKPSGGGDGHLSGNTDGDNRASGSNGHVGFGHGRTRLCVSMAFLLRKRQRCSWILWL